MANVVPCVWPPGSCHAASGQNYDVNPIDNMFCECKEVQSVEGCSNYGNTKFGLSSGIPRYYHEQVGKSEFEAKCIQMQGIVA